MSTPSKTAVAGGPQPAPPSPPPDGPGRQRARTIPWSKITPYLLITPALVMELLIHIVPMLAGIGMSFLELTQFYIARWTQAPFAGTRNYRAAFDLSGSLGLSVLQSFLITVLFTVLVVGISWLIGMSASVVLQRSFRGRGVLRTLFLVPYALPAYAGIITWSFLLQRDNGLVNQVLTSLRIVDEPTFWLLGTNAFISTTIVTIWQMFPFAFLMTMAGMQSIPEELYQAAALDGASVWQQLRHVTLGMLRPINSVLLLLLTLWTFREFNTPYVLFGSNPPESVNLLSVHIYDSSFLNWNFGFGAAMSVLMLLFLLVVAGVWMLLSNRGRRRAA
ncbi:carbohydrate ABC transporter permease [Pseudonocardia alaniniphila]|uniref:Sugar ABC transporter permease n=1 Tax=Pseudonocardia alaniniphila TaxID=75291 RepID=A0ABS9TU96_9PSEU|nr:sugar ABC transporter permease [Pseudonocardia alaniniphila]MCH6172072.1 sugar ABC transporter permease [Pseudonocardia alaniniphila]